MALWSLPLLLYFLLTHLMPCATPLSFNFSNIFDHQNEIILVNQASFSPSQGLQLTPEDENSNRDYTANRATYIHPLHIWDKSSEKLADFSTNFTFVIDSSANPNHGDGLSFFLAHNNSAKRNIHFGRTLGLPVDHMTGQGTDPFVAVEFDTFWNIEFDPENSNIGNHVGINIKSLWSVAYRKWYNNINRGAENKVWVNYDAASQNLSVSFTSYQNNQEVIESGLSSTIDLKQHLPEWVLFGFSAATGREIQAHRIKSWSFTSTTFEVDEEDLNNRGSQMTGFVAKVSIGSGVLVILLVLFYLYLRKIRREKRKRDDLEVHGLMDNEFEKCSGPKKFSYEELARATNNFMNDNKLGEGGFGGVYKGFLTNSSTCIAVKRVSSSSSQGKKEYMSEVKIISRLRHRNLVQLIGWCHEREELLLVYEFMENGSLDSHLFNQRSLLTWGTRFKIARGIASALLYLHEEWEQYVVHRDIKSSNIMLDTSFNVKVGDFGLARLVDHEKEVQTTLVAGTLGYMAPEYMETGKASKESDVFSFGVVALEIACGRKALDFKVHESQVRLVEWVWNLYGIGELLDAADPKMDSVYDNQEIERLMIVGLWCAHPNSDIRPSIRQAVQVLNVEAPLPILPSKMPIPTFFAPPTNFFSLTVGDSSQANSSSYCSNTHSSKLTGGLFSICLTFVHKISWSAVL